MLSRAPHRHECAYITVNAYSFFCVPPLMALAPAALPTSPYSGHTFFVDRVPGPVCGPCLPWTHLYALTSSSDPSRAPSWICPWPLMACSATCGRTASAPCWARGGEIFVNSSLVEPADGHASAAGSPSAWSG